MVASLTMKSRCWRNSAATLGMNSSLTLLMMKCKKRKTLNRQFDSVISKPGTEQTKSEIFGASGLIAPPRPLSRGLNRKA